MKSQIQSLKKIGGRYQYPDRPLKHPGGLIHKLKSVKAVKDGSRPRWMGVLKTGKTIDIPYDIAAAFKTKQGGSLFRESVQSLSNQLKKKYPGVRFFIGQKPSDAYGRKILSLEDIVISKEERGKGTGSRFMQDLINYGDTNKSIIALKVTSEYGTSVSQLKTFYAKFGFEKNKESAITADMVRYPLKEGLAEATIGEKYERLKPATVVGVLKKAGFPNVYYPTKGEAARGKTHRPGFRATRGNPFMVIVDCRIKGDIKATSKQYQAALVKVGLKVDTPWPDKTMLSVTKPKSLTESKLERLTDQYNTKPAVARYYFGMDKLPTRIKIWRACESGNIKRGDFVTADKEMAELHMRTDKYKLVNKVVPPAHLRVVGSSGKKGNTEFIYEP